MLLRNETAVKAEKEVTKSPKLKSNCKQHTFREALRFGWLAHESMKCPKSIDLKCPKSIDHKKFKALVKAEKHRVSACTGKRMHSTKFIGDCIRKEIDDFGKRPGLHRAPQGSLGNPRKPWIVGYFWGFFLYFLNF